MSHSMSDLRWLGVELRSTTEISLFIIIFCCLLSKVFSKPESKILKEGAQRRLSMYLSCDRIRKMAMGWIRGPEFKSSSSSSSLCEYMIHLLCWIFRKIITFVKRVVRLWWAKMQKHNEQSRFKVVLVWGEFGSTSCAVILYFIKFRYLLKIKYLKKPEVNSKYYFKFIILSISVSVNYFKWSYSSEWIKYRRTNCILF